jgi:hypothetical protein
MFKGRRMQPSPPTRNKNKEEIMEKKILDMTCGARQMWFDKNNESALFIDNRCEKIQMPNGSVLDINPDLIADYTKLPFIDECFYLVVFDPEHRNDLGKDSWMEKQYGNLPADWLSKIVDGINEGMRVLKPNGTLIFKWNTKQFKVKDIFEAVDYKPAFGHTSGRTGNTIWITFFKGETK